MTQMTSGLVGLLLGGVVGLVLTVIFEDPLKRFLASGTTRVRRAWSRGLLPAVRREFSLGPLQTQLLIVEGYGEQVVDEQALRVVIDHRQPDLPPDLAAWRDEVTAEQKARQDSGLHAHWNGATYAVAGLSDSRSGIEVAPAVCLRCSRATTSRLGHAATRSCPSRRVDTSSQVPGPTSARGSP